MHTLSFATYIHRVASFLLQTCYPRVNCPVHQLLGQTLFDAKACQWASAAGGGRGFWRQEAVLPTSAFTVTR